MSFLGMGDLEGLDDLLVSFGRPREPEFQEAKRRVRKVLVENRQSWITQEGVAKRSGLSERAVAAALDTLRVEGSAKRGKSRERGVVWRWK